MSWIVPLLIASTFLAFSAPAQVVRTHPLGVSPMILTQTSTSISKGFEPIGEEETFVQYSWTTLQGRTIPAKTVGGVTYPAVIIPSIGILDPVTTFTIPALKLPATRTVEVQQFITTMTTVYTAQTWQGMALEGIVGPLPSYWRSVLLGILLGLAVSVPISSYRHTKPIR